MHTCDKKNSELPKEKVGSFLSSTKMLFTHIKQNLQEFSNDSKLFTPWKATRAGCVKPYSCYDTETTSNRCLIDIECSAMSNISTIYDNSTWCLKISR